MVIDRSHPRFPEEQKLSQLNILQVLSDVYVALQTFPFELLSHTFMDYAYKVSTFWQSIIYNFFNAMHFLLINLPLLRVHSLSFREIVLYAE